MAYDANTNYDNERKYLNNLIAAGGGNAEWAKQQMTVLNAAQAQYQPAASPLSGQTGTPALSGARTASTILAPDGKTNLTAHDWKQDTTDYASLMLGAKSPAEFDKYAQDRVNQAAAQNIDNSANSNAKIYNQWSSGTGAQPSTYRTSSGGTQQGYYGMDGSGNWGYYSDAGLTQKQDNGHWEDYKASDGGTALFDMKNGYLWPSNVKDESRAGQTVILTAGNNAYEVKYNQNGYVSSVGNLTAAKGISGYDLDLPTARSLNDRGVSSQALMKQSTGYDYAGPGGAISGTDVPAATREDYNSIYGKSNSTPYSGAIETVYPSHTPHSEDTVYSKREPSSGSASYPNNDFTGGGTGTGGTGTGGTGTGGTVTGGTVTGGTGTGGTGGTDGGGGRDIGTPPTVTGEQAAQNTQTGPSEREQYMQSLIDELHGMYAEQNRRYQAMLDEQRRAKEAAVARAVSSLEGQKTSANRSYADLFRQLYIDRMNAEKNIGQRMAAQGMTGGAAESTLLGLGTQYEDALRQGEQSRLNALDNIDRAITDARLSGDISIAEQTANLTKQGIDSYADVLRSLIAQQNADRAYNYQVGRDAVSDQQWGQQFGLQEQQLALQAQQAAANIAAKQASAAASASNAAASQQLAANKWAYQQQQDAYNQQVALAKLAAQYGDYSGLNALGIDTTSYAAQLAAARAAQEEQDAAETPYKPQFTIAQVNSAIKNNTVTPTVLDAYQYYYGVPYGSEGTTPYVGYAANGAAYTIGSTTGINFIRDAKPGATLTGADGSQWVKNANGSVSITKNGTTYTVG